MPDALTPLGAALDRAAAAGRTIRVWLRDDDCVAPTPALERLATLCDAVRLPVLLAVIPEPAEAALGGWIRDHARVTPCQHGFAHANHAPPGKRSIELGGARPIADALSDLARGRAKLRELFGGRLSDMLVPPWNRIDPALVAHLRDLGFTAFSTIASARAATPATEAYAMPRVDVDLDVMDWRGGRVGRALPDLAAEAASIVDRQDRLGLLTHHLVHDEGAWAGLGALLAAIGSHPAVAISSAEDLVASDRDGVKTSVASAPG